VTRILLDSICGASCCSVVGTFISGGGGGTLEQFLECVETNIHECSTAGSNGGRGAVIEVNKGPFDVRRTNFSNCQQNSDAAVFRQSSVGGIIAVGWLYVTCNRCSGSGGFVVAYDAKVGFQENVFMNNTVSDNGWLTFTGTSLTVWKCDFFKCEGIIFKITNSGTHVIIWGCRFDKVDFPGNLDNVGLSISHEVLGYPNTVTLGPTQAGLCFFLDTLPSDVFTASLTFSGSDKLSNTPVTDRTGTLSRTQDVSESADQVSTRDFNVSSANFVSSRLTQTSDFSPSCGFSSTERLSKSDGPTATEGLSETTKLGMTGALSRSVYYSGSELCSESSLKSKSEEYRVSDRQSGTNDFTDSVDLSLTRWFGSSDPLPSTLGLGESIRLSETHNPTESDYFEASATGNILPALETPSKSIDLTGSVMIPVRPSTMPFASSIPPVSTVFPASTQWLAAGQSPPPTFTPVATNLLESTAPPITTLILPTESLASTPFPASTLFPASTGIPMSTLLPEPTLPPVQTNVIATTYPPASSHVLASGQTPVSTEILRTVEPVESTVPVASSVAPQSSLPMASTIPLEATAYPASTFAATSWQPPASSARLVAPSSREIVRSSSSGSGQSSRIQTIVLSTAVGQTWETSSGIQTGHNLTDAAQVTEDGSSGVALLIVSILMMVLFMGVFSYLVSREKHWFNLERDKQLRDNKPKGGGKESKILVVQNS
jgi:hypothetical protein